MATGNGATTLGCSSSKRFRPPRASMAALVAIGIGLALVAYRGWPVLAISAASLLAALAYMGGPRPIAYTPLGELTVFVCFGLVAVTGTDWVLTGSIGQVSVLASAAIGSLAAALAVNNHRDIAHDRLVGRRTFAVRFGEHASRRLFDALVLAPYLLLPLTLRRDFASRPRIVAFSGSAKGASRRCRWQPCQRCHRAVVDAPPRSLARPRRTRRQALHSGQVRGDAGMALQKFVQRRAALL